VFHHRQQACLFFLPHKSCQQNPCVSRSLQTRDPYSWNFE
jgi:hypothetical protein